MKKKITQGSKCTENATTEARRSKREKQIITKIVIINSIITQKNSKPPMYRLA
jgi:hypothetical protein